jgi:uncharacterized protein (DUF488 family)
MLYSIGHSTRSYDELVEALHALGVATLVDIRTITRSRAHPQLDRSRLAAALEDRGSHAQCRLAGRGIP